MKTLRVLHVIQCLHGYGAERQVRELLAHLQSDDMQVAAATVYPSGLTGQELAALPYSTFEAGRKNRRDFSFLPRLVREIRGFSPHIVHAHTHSGKYWGRVAAWLAGVQHVVYTEHNPCSPLRGRLAELIDPFLNAHTTRIVTFLSEQRSYLAETQRTEIEKIAVIANGLPAVEQHDDTRARARSLLEIRPDQFAVYAIGRFTEQKNQTLMLRVVAELDASLRERLLLFFIGSGADETLLRELAGELDIQTNIRFLGYRKDVLELLPGADLLLSTSLFEGMPLTLIEAMTARVPILSTPWIGASEMLANGIYGFITPTWEAQSVAAQLERAMSQPRVRRDMALRACAYATHAFDIGRTAEQHRRLYHQICDGNCA